MTLQTCAAPIGRVMLSAIFLMALLNKLTNFDGVIGYMQFMGMTFATSLFLVGAIVLLALGGFSVLLGYKAKIGATLLLIFLVPATLIFHSNVSDQIQGLMFLKNVAIMGGLLLIIAHGSGAYSLDNRLK